MPEDRSLDLVGLADHTERLAREAEAAERNINLRVMEVGGREFYVDKSGRLRDPSAEEASRASLVYRRDAIAAAKDARPLIIEARSLQAVVDYANLHHSEVMVTVSPTQVSVTRLNRSVDGIHERLLVARCEPFEFPLGAWRDPEEIHTGLLSWFDASQGYPDQAQEDDGGPRTDLERLFRLFKEGCTLTEVRQVAGDGVSQQVRTADELGMAAWADIGKPRFRLYPFRTFLEVKQPAGLFTLALRKRVVDCSKIIEAKLVSADGGAWKVEACKLIQAWLVDAGLECPTIG